MNMSHWTTGGPITTLTKEGVKFLAEETTQHFVAGTWPNAASPRGDLSTRQQDDNACSRAGLQSKEATQPK